MAAQTVTDSSVTQVQNGQVNGVHPAQNKDPIIEILAAFYSVPDEYHGDLFKDFREAAEAQDLRRLLDTISDWAATAELYAHPTLAVELKEAIGGREGVADWLTG